MKKILSVIIMAMIVMLACSPISKESYIKQYDAFISEVSENYKSYDDKAWEKQTAKYEKFSGEWYNKFKTELALKEELAIKANQAKWYYYRNMNAATSVVKQLFESLDVKGMKKQVQYYIDNNMQSDLQKFYKDAQKAGKAVEETVTDILEELDVNIEELQ